MNYLIKTIGCQMNISESMRIDSTLAAYGASRVDDLLYTDVIILNTCSVRAQSEQKAFSYLGKLEELQRMNMKRVKIIVFGCMVKRLGYKIKNRFKSIDLIIESEDINNVIAKIINSLQISTNFNVQQKNKRILFNVSKYIPIMKGCNNYCSYCIVPIVRGVERSLDFNTLLNECYIAVKNSVKEIILLGQNVNSYQFDSINFVSLIKKICSIEKLKRISFMTNHPKDFNDDLINIISNEIKICSHIHLPLQSASNRILSAMNRKYTFEYYLELIEKIKTIIPDISITTDIIVGFPGETEKDFIETLNAVKKIKFNGLYVFKYSLRPNTKAAEMPDDVTLSDKKKRHTIILQEAKKSSIEKKYKMIGSKQQVLIKKIRNDIMEASTRNCQKIIISGGKQSDVGEFRNVYISNIVKSNLVGRII
ncbi:MAG: tRNA (N6-isopentenyl adenosine(37)-C2)-methylthiotransferase MiaB [Endomicrobium sp.]|jgi:tRNA-2-methylthio-N6-dimethylallyladenosine synthase|nr:tRNA (N6-isopentenyl adenosine(37)-C2)-methylthiotransferase MiaB [Endomicrobium sp.]